MIWLAVGVAIIIARFILGFDTADGSLFLALTLILVGIFRIFIVTPKNKDTK